MSLSGDSNEGKKKEKKKYERTVQSLNRNPCLPGILSCYIVPFMLLIHSILFFFVKEEKRGANNRRRYCSVSLQVSSFHAVSQS
jgi:hypothetical protein